MLGLVGFTATCQQEKELTTQMAGADAWLPLCRPERGQQRWQKQPEMPADDPLLKHNYGISVCSA